jgi:hypothetical protein
VNLTRECSIAALSVCDYLTAFTRGEESSIQPNGLLLILGGVFLEITNLPEHSIVSVAVDVMAMNADHSCLPSKKSDSAFVIFVQPLDRRYRCLPLHVMRHESGEVTPDVQAAIAEVCEALWRHQIVVKYKCADGDKGHNEAHRKFLND